MSSSSSSTAGTLNSCPACAVTSCGVVMLQDTPMYAYLPVKDVARARTFYEKTLGFRPSEEIAGGVVYKFANGTASFLYPTPNAGTNRASQAFWQVGDVERTVAELKSRGVT